MRKTRILAFTTVLALILGACGGSAAEPQTTTTTASAPTTTMAPQETTTTQAPQRDLIPPPGVGSETTQDTGTATETPSSQQTDPLAVCETPDDSLAVEVQQEACLEYLAAWLNQKLSPSAFRIGLWGWNIEKNADGVNTMTIVFAATDPQDAYLAETYRNQAVAQYPMPEWLLGEAALQGIDEQVAAAVEANADARKQYIGITLLAYASYADLLGVDALVARVAYPDAEAGSGYVVVDYTTPPEQVLQIAPMTFGAFLQGATQEEVAALVAALPEIVEAAERTVVEAPTEE